MRSCDADVRAVVELLASDIQPLAQDRPDLAIRIKVCDEPERSAWPCFGAWHHAVKAL